MKRFISVFLCTLLLIGSISIISFSATTQLTVQQAVENYEAETGEKIDTNRYYFLMPDGTNGTIGKQDEWVFEDQYVPSWYNDNADHAGIYWWDTGKVEPYSWPGYKMLKADSDSIYYADVPDFVESVVFNNNFDGGMDPNSPVYNDSKQTATVYTCGYEADESLVYPQGLESFDNMIFVIDPDMYMYGDISSVGKIWWGEWYYYYQNGCYGTVKDGDEHNCIRDDHEHTFGPEPDRATIYAKDALEEYEKQNNVELSTYRYYFMMPNGTNGNTGIDEYEGKFCQSWYSEYTSAPAAYWWDSTDFIPSSFPGYIMEKADTDNVFYVDVPDIVTMIIFNNNVCFSLDEKELFKKYNHQTNNIACEYYDPGESEYYPDGTENFDQMIYVLHPTVNTVSDSNQKQTYKGEWFYYYGNDCYGTVKNGNSRNCIHPSHFDSNGKHIDLSDEYTRTFSISPEANTAFKDIDGYCYGYIGDADCDDVVSVMDATAIQLHLTDIERLPAAVCKLADADADGEVSVMDATAIQLHLVEAVTSDIIEHVLYTPYDDFDPMYNTFYEIQEFVQNNGMEYETGKSYFSNFYKEEGGNVTVTIESDTNNDVITMSTDTYVEEAEAFVFTEITFSLGSKTMSVYTKAYDAYITAYEATATANLTDINLEESSYKIDIDFTSFKSDYGVSKESIEATLPDQIMVTTSMCEQLVIYDVVGTPLDLVYDVQSLVKV